MGKELPNGKIAKTNEPTERQTPWFMKLTIGYAQLLPIIQNLRGFCWPNPMREDSSQRDHGLARIIRTGGIPLKNVDTLERPIHTGLLHEYGVNPSMLVVDTDATASADSSNWGEVSNSCDTWRAPLLEFLCVDLHNQCDNVINQCYFIFCIVVHNKAGHIVA